MRSTFVPRSRKVPGSRNGTKIGYGKENIERLRRDLLDKIPGGSLLRGEVTRCFTNKQPLNVESIEKRLSLSGVRVGHELKGRMEDYNSHC